MACNQKTSKIENVKYCTMIYNTKYYFLLHLSFKWKIY